MKAFVLAGGFATRLWPLTHKRAKPLLPLAGKPLLNHLLEKIPEEIEVYVSTNAAFEQGFNDWAEAGIKRDIKVVVETTKGDDDKLGALGALAQWITTEKIEDDILVLTGDNYLGFEITDFIATQREGVPLIAAYDLEDLEQAMQFGTVILNSDGTVKEFEEKPLEPKSTLVNTGCCILPKSNLPVLVEYAAVNPDNLGGIFEEIVRQGIELDCYRFTGHWFDIGSFEAYLQATQAIIGEKILKSDDSKIENSQCEGSVVIGPNCSVKDSKLTNVILFDDCQILACTLENCIVDKGSFLQGIDLNGKMLKENTKLIINNSL